MAERVRIAGGSGAVLIVGEDRGEIDVQGATATTADGEISVRGGSHSFTVRVPLGTDVFVGSGSGNVVLDGVLGAVSVTTKSADVSAADVASIDARTTSGKLRVERSRGTVRLKAKSAALYVGVAEDEVRIATVSGRITVDDARGAVSVKTVSGDIRVLVTGRSPVVAETISGKISVTLPAGVRPNVRHRTMSGKLRDGTEPGDDLQIVARSISGDLRIGVA